MVKRILTILLIFLFLNLPSLVDAQVDHLVFLDGNQEKYMTNKEANEFRTRLEEISDKHNADFVIIFKENVGNAQSYAEQYYVNNNLGRGPNKDGVILLINMGGGVGNRDIYIATHGISKEYITDSKREKLLDALIDNGLGDYIYYEPISAYIDRLDKFHRGNYVSPIDALISALAGLFASGGYAASVKREYKASNPSKQYRMASNAIANYSNSDDHFIREYTTSRTLPKPSSSSSGGGGSSGGSSSFGGGGRKF